MNEQERIKQNQQIDKFLSRFKSSGLSYKIKEILAPIIERSQNPESFVVEAVSDANHDLVMLEMIEDGIELLIKAVNAKL